MNTEMRSSSLAALERISVGICGAQREETIDGTRLNLTSQGGP